MSLIGKTIVEKWYDVMTRTSRSGTIEIHYTIKEQNGEILTVETTRNERTHSIGDTKTFHIEEINIDNNNYSCKLY